MKSDNFSALIGIDWADRKHDICLLDCATGKRHYSVLKHSAEEIEQWAFALQKRFAGAPIAICLEQSKGALIYALQKYDFLVLYPVNPTMLAKYREAFSLSKAKDNPTDAAFLLELLQVHPDRLTRLKLEPVPVRLLQQLVEDRRTVMNDRKRLGNRLTSTLKKYYPLVLELFPKMGRNVLCQFILKWPKLEELQAATDEEVISFFKQHNSSGHKLLEKRLNLIHAAIPLTTDSAIIAGSLRQAVALCSQIIEHNKVLEEYEERIDEIYQSLPDARIFSSLPGAGSNYAPRLLAAIGTDRNRFSSAHDLQCFAGISPVVERSGKQSWTRWRYSCSKFIRQSVHEWAGETIRRSFWARTFYLQQRAKGNSHSVAVRALAFKWLRIIYRLWSTKTTYDESRYLEALQKSGSPLLRTLTIDGAAE